jgi:ATP-dependent Lhr-like helicase
LWIAAERLPELGAVHADLTIEPVIEAPPARAAKSWTRGDAIVELLRGRLAIVGPTTAEALAEALGITASDADAGLLALEAEGVVLRGHFRESGDSRGSQGPESGAAELSRESGDGAESEIGSRPRMVEWCDRRLLARIHRYTLNRLRAEIEPVSQADFMRYLFAWQHADPATRLAGIDGLRAIIEALDGFELAAEAWERIVLPARVEGYQPSLLDTLSLTGEVGWARLSAPIDVTQLVGATPIALFLREHAEAWATLRADASTASEGSAADDPRAPHPILNRLNGHASDPYTGQSSDGDRVRSHPGGPGDTPATARILATLAARGASFVHDLVNASGAADRDVRAALGELVACGLVASDGFGGLRSMIRAAGGRQPGASRANVTGRWSLTVSARGAERCDRGAAVEMQARALLRRYGIVFRRLLAREATSAAWRELARVYRRLEARGEIRGGRFVAGMSGEQFALPEAVERLREVRRTAPDGRLHVISGADPLNLAGIVTAGERVRAVAATRLVYRDGIPLAALEGDYMRPLVEAGIAPAVASEVTSLLAGRPRPAVTSGFVGR